ncbi:YdcF family protein [Labrys monachus]|uniref:Uncharacterized SAM-binding protein YcdF (DUF218 family) n=1 Tax=Labrys monachus TaxID=217067 RepID=A0ABU0FMS6_9HYPH|nr:YdcF family protein [Labrys monachus]MDQ0395919.1 uncharacterized SAM-binding protein YcdF (DUF218 family) [Labrys monachus]
MFYYVAKAVGFVATASNAVFLIGLLGLLLCLRRRSRAFGCVLMGASIVLLAVFGLSPAGNLMLAPLEDRFPPAAIAPGTDIAGIIVLGGAVDTHLASMRHQSGLNDSAERMTVVPALARLYPQARIIFTGGIGLPSLTQNDVPEATVAKQLFESFGIPDERMVFESKSRDTYENAQFTRDLLQPAPGQRYLLVTSAFHMPRAMGLFRKAGFDVLPYPVNYRTAGPADDWLPFFNVGDGLRQSNVASHEWLGLLGYRLAGRIDDLFPKP